MRAMLAACPSAWMPAASSVRGARPTACACSPTARNRAAEFGIRPNAVAIVGAASLTCHDRSELRYQLGTIAVSETGFCCPFAA